MRHGKEMHSEKSRNVDREASIPLGQSGIGSCDDDSISRFVVEPAELQLGMFVMVLVDCSIPT
jgi:hypothetical protein